MKDCVRAAPEFLGYGSPSGGVVAGVLCSLLVLALCCCCLSQGCKVFLGAVPPMAPPPLATAASLSAALAAAPNSGGGDGTDYVELRRMSSDGTELEDPSAHHLHLYPHDSGGRSGSSSGSGGGDSGAASAYQGGRKGRVLYIMCVVVAVGTTLFLALLSAFALANYPQLPVYNVCASRFDWSSLLRNLRRFGLGGDFDVLVSVHNPNHVTLRLSAASLQFQYQGAQVATWQFQGTFDIPAGSVADLVAPITFSPSLLQAWRMFDDFEANSLAFDVTASVSIALLLRDNPHFAMTLPGLKSRMQVGAHTDRSLCSCPWM